MMLADIAERGAMGDGWTSASDESSLAAAVVVMEVAAVAREMKSIIEDGGRRDQHTEGCTLYIVNKLQKIVYMIRTPPQGRSGTS